MGLDLAQAPVTLIGSCGRDPGIACRLVWDVSHSGTAARLTAVYLAGPANLVLKLAWLVFLALVARALVHRLINRVTIRAADSPLHTRLRQSTGVRVRRKLWGRRRQRERAVTETALAEADHALTGTASSTGTSARPDTAAVHEAASERRHQRAHALGSILRNASSVTIFAIATAIGLGDLGVNLAPVLASAGVVGIAVGFGAQNLVRDFLAGIFMLLEDQYGVGDVINIGDATGTVEAVSLRTTRLRDVNGVVWHLRNGALEKVGNESQGWARAVVDVPVPPGLDIADTRQVMEQEAGAMWRERRWRKLMLEKPEVWGVQDISITDSQVVMRVAAKTLPLRQWEVARELRERVKSALDAGRPAPLEARPSRAHPARKTARATASRKAATMEADEGATANANNGAAVEAEEDVAVEAAQGAAVEAAEAAEDVAERGPRSAP
jgi:small conductance mechanosensitive channel